MKLLARQNFADLKVNKILNTLSFSAKTSSPPLITHLPLKLSWFLPTNETQSVILIETFC